jgi:FkbM family methyltransferase
VTLSLSRLQRAFKEGQITKVDFITQAHAVHKHLFNYCNSLGNDIKAINISDEGVIFTTAKGVRIQCDPDDFRAPPIEAINFGDYEAGDADLLWSLLKPNQCIIDVGAHIGWYALHAAVSFPTSRILAIEPIPTSATLLRKNIQLNQATNIAIEECALSDRAGLVEMFVPTNMPTAASTADLFQSGNPLKIQTRPLDDIVHQRGLIPNLIKIDVEGNELAVLKGAETTLRRYRPTVFCEMLRKWTAAHQYHPNDTIQFMASLGYECRYGQPPVLTRLERMTDEVQATNFVFQPLGIAVT